MSTFIRGIKSQCILIPKGFSFLLLSKVLSGTYKGDENLLHTGRALARYMFEI